MTPSPASRFEGKVVVVTGAARGIGAHTARRFADEGACVVLCDLDEAGVAAVAGDLPAAVGLRADVTAKADLQRVVASAVDTFGGLDVWINNAMICSDTPFLELSEEELRRDIDVNLVGGMLAAQAALPALIARGGGVILNLVSVNALSFLGNDAYSAAKAGLIAFTRGLAVQYGDRGVRAVAVAPGTIETEQWAHRIEVDPGILQDAARWYPTGRIGQPEDVAQTLLFLASDAASWITGTVITVDGGLLAGNRAMAEGIVPESRS